MKQLTQTVDGQDRPLYILLNTDKARSVRKNRVFSNTLSAPYTDEDSGVEFLEIWVDDEPVYDTIYQFLVTTEAIGPKGDIWLITHQVNDRTKEEAIAIIEDAKRQEIQKQAPTDVYTEDGILILAALVRAGKLNLTATEQAAADRILDRSVKLANNISNEAAKKSEIEAGGKPDPKGGWEAAAAEIRVL
jgi:hypothetical protein